MTEEGFVEVPMPSHYPVDPTLSNRLFFDPDFVVLGGTKPPDPLEQDTRPQHSYPDYLGVPNTPPGTPCSSTPDSSQLVFAQTPHQVFLQEPPLLGDMFEFADPTTPVVMAAEETTYLDEDVFGGPPEIMRMCLQDALNSDAFLHDAAAAAPAYPVAYAADSTVSSTLGVRDVPTDAEVCTVCFGVFPSRAGLARHRRLAHQPRVWNVCDVCGKGLATPRSLRLHKMRHAGLKPFVCAICGTGFYERSCLRHHQRAKHDGQEEPPDVKDFIKEAAMDVGLHVVHQQGGVEGGGVVFQRAESGDVVGIVATPRTLAPAPAPAEANDVAVVNMQPEDEDGIVLRLVRCKDQDGAWKVVHVTKF